MSEFEKRTETIKSTEVVYYRNGEEIGRLERNDHWLYDATDREPMSKAEIEDWSS